ncbi:MAG TPA: amidohydrolase family protein [Pseudolabrys sp.]|nr:amidohydrolase family protein [Pseudolabrys sp.]
MPIDVHAHYVPPSILDDVEAQADRFGLSVVRDGPSCACALHFKYGLKVRPFFPRLIEPVDERLAGMAKQEVDRQVLSSWADIFAYGLPRAQACEWHRFLNQHLAKLCDAQPARFSMLASVPLPHAQESAAELEYAVRELGAVGVVVAANVEGTNLGELDLDSFWQKAVDLDIGVFIHPVQAQPMPRSAKFGLSQVAQYTVDTTLCVGSLIGAGVLDRFAELRLLLSHGGGTFPYLTGRFDCMHGRMDRKAQGHVARQPPSAYLTRFYYDTILHDPSILRWLSQRVGITQIVLGSDYSFPPADLDPVGTVRAAGFAPAEIQAILERNPRALFPQLPE